MFIQNFLMLFYILTGFVILQRLVELVIAKRNERVSLKAGGKVYDRKGYSVIVIMHVFFFISLIAEYLYFERTLNKYWIVFLVLFIAAQALRYWAIISLGSQWNTRIIIVPGLKLVKHGPFKYFRHPNYMAVITELAVLPLIFSCFYTAVIFSTLNLLLLKRRIEIEEKALDNLINE
ncbi:MAG TPA: isoprenylcysteine carboxylmethyltransferase family protein [Ignavibacteria bacterium]|nr:isoprenylcysteine carboxylmethyltransferase family protein [Ignavibacteria bacterium]